MILIAVERGARIAEMRGKHLMGGVDLNRISQLFYLQIPRAIDAIEKELVGLMEIASATSLLELTIASDPRCRKMHRLRSMIAMKKKVPKSTKRAW